MGGGDGYSTLVVVNATEDGETYARRWLEMNGKKAEPAAIGQWTQHHQALGIRYIGTGVMALRRRHPDGGTPWFANFVAPLIKSPRKADHFRQLMALQDFLGDVAGDEADPGPLLSCALRPAEGHELFRTHVFRDGAYQPTDAKARIGNGFPFAGSLDLGTAELLSRCGRDRSLGAVLAELAAEHGIDPVGMEARALPYVHKMITLGLLLPPEIADLAPEAAAVQS